MSERWPTRAKDGRLMSAGGWGTNAKLIRDVFELYQIPLTTRTVDLTYGLGSFWTEIRPDSLVAHDLDREKGDGVDYTDLPEDDCTYALSVYDPTYVPPGARDTSTLGLDQEFWKRFGMHMAPATPKELWAVIAAGFHEGHRVLQPGGMMMVKAQDFNWGNVFYPFTHWVQGLADEHGMEHVDRFDFLRAPSRQPTYVVGKKPSGDDPGVKRVWRSAARNQSTLLLFRRTEPAVDPQLSLL